jgi:RNA-directed DNA polymerase
VSVTPLTHPGARRYTMAEYGRPEPRYRQRRRARAEMLQSRGRGIPSLSRLAEPENLIDVYNRMRRDAGQAPGRDGLTYADLGRSEIADALRKVSRAILDGTYLPRESRPVSVRKRSGVGSRTLRLRDIVDRVAEEAVHLEVSPYLDQFFLEQSWGFRPRRNVWGMLAYLECQMVTLDCWVVTTDDIRDAFDHVRLAALADAHRQLLGTIVDGAGRSVDNSGLLVLLDRIVRGSDRPARVAGINQGGPYSPTALNLHLHHVHDLGIARDPTIPTWARYADNVAYVTQDVPSGHQARATAGALLHAHGMRLKGSDGPPADLRTSTDATLLGFRLRRNIGGAGIDLSLGPDAWEGLRLGLAGCHDAKDPVTAAQQTVMGWIAAAGPACEMPTRLEMIERILLLAAEQGFRELYSPEAIADGLESAHARWLRCRDSIWERHDRRLVGPGEEAASSTPVPASPSDPGS